MKVLLRYLLLSSLFLITVSGLEISNLPSNIQDKCGEETINSCSCQSGVPVGVCVLDMCTCGDKNVALRPLPRPRPHNPHQHSSIDNAHISKKLMLANIVLKMCPQDAPPQECPCGSNTGPLVDFTGTADEIAARIWKCKPRKCKCQNEEDFKSVVERKQRNAIKPKIPKKPKPHRSGLNGPADKPKRKPFAPKPKSHRYPLSQYFNRPRMSRCSDGSSPTSCKCQDNTEQEATNIFLLFLLKSCKPTKCFCGPDKSEEVIITEFGCEQGGIPTCAEERERPKCRDSGKEITLAKEIYKQRRRPTPTCMCDDNQLPLCADQAEPTCPNGEPMKALDSAAPAIANCSG